MTVVVRERRLPPPEFGPTLRRARKAAGLTPSTLARRTGLTPSYVSKLERGTRAPSRTVAARLADALHVDAEQRHVLLAGAVDDAGADHPARRAA
jgi:transcriptional regulator with XRE-family HTH domain